MNILCRLFGHKWSNRGLITIIDGEEMVAFSCKRCGEKQISGISFVDTISEIKIRNKEAS